MKITLGQINPTIGDMEGNVARMHEVALQAQAEGATLVVFPELSLTAYHPGDLLDEGAFLDRVDAGLAKLLEASGQLPSLYWVVGAPMRRAGPGKRLHNMLLVLHAGQIVLRYAKQLLPTYGIFDERRHFEPGPEGAKVPLLTE